jgi:hypothetical protein
VFRAVLPSVLFLAVAAGCGCAHAKPGTQLTITGLNSSVGRAVFHLECAPTGGDLPNPARACAAVARTPQLVTRPRRFVCAGGTFSWWDVTISGRLNGNPIARTFSTCWTTQTATLGRLGLSWNVLRRHLLPRRHETVLAGSTHVFPPGVLRATDLVSCEILGHHLELGVPVETGPSASMGWGGAHVVSVTLVVGRNRDGSVTASCHRGGG